MIEVWRAGAVHELLLREIVKMPLAIFHPDSMAPTAEKAQLDPHLPLFLTSVTVFLVRQSTVTGICTSPVSGTSEDEDSKTGIGF